MIAEDTAKSSVVPLLTVAKRRVVVLDDDLTMLGAVERLLVRAGFSVLATHEPMRAIEAVLHEDVAAIVSDLYMPEVGGNVVLAMLAKAAPKTARILLTSETDFNNFASLSVPCAVDAYLQKRDVSSRLVGTLHELVADRAEGASTLGDDESRDLARSVARALRRYATGDEVATNRLVAWSRLLAEAAGLTPAGVLDVELGAILHDIGDVGLSAALLGRTGPLTADEWKEVRRHPDTGAALLSDLAALRRAIPVVRHHHERYDGQGYPRGLAGNHIPLAARIFQIVDAYDAIVSDRPHRLGRSDEAARAELARHAGTQFDPDIHDVFQRIDSDEWRTAGIPVSSGSSGPRSSLVSSGASSGGHAASRGQRGG